MEKELRNNAIIFADWIVKKGYKLNQMNYSNNGGMWFLNKDSVGVTSYELYEQFYSESISSQSVNK